MTIALRKDKKAKISDALSKADRIAIALGGKRFRPEEAVVASDFELEEFLKWRDERRKSELEEQRDCPL